MIMNFQFSGEFDLLPIYLYTVADNHIKNELLTLNKNEFKWIVSIGCVIIPHFKRLKYCYINFLKLKLLIQKQN